MKNRLLFLVLVLIAHYGFAQNQPEEPPYKRFPTVPPISILQVDSTTLTKEKLKHQPTIIMYFSPDCDHCKHQWADMKQDMEKLKKYQIVLITHQPFEQMQEFYEKEQLATYANIRLGQDTKFFLPPFYKMNSLPYLALYDKNWDLITTFEGNVKINKLLAAFKK